MSVIMQTGTLAVTMVLGVWLVYEILQMRRGYAEQQGNVARAIFAAEEFRKLEEEFISYLRRIESDGRALQKVTVQVEVAVAALKEAISTSMSAASERQTSAVENLRDHLDTQEERLAKILEGISEGIRAIPQHPSSSFRPGNADNSRLRRQILNQDPELRFSVLKEWISVNTLAILHRASRGWTTANELIANIPPYLETEAEILRNCVLLIGTREHCGRLAIPLRALESSSEFSPWFDPASGQRPPHVPAFLTRSQGQWQLVTKGTNLAAGLPAA